jgi:hypothetical protein
MLIFSGKERQNNNSAIMMFINRQESLISSMLRIFVVVAVLLPWAVVDGAFIDMDTPLDKRTTKSLVDKSVYHLVCVVDLIFL